MPLCCKMKNEPSEPRQERMTRKPYENCICTDTSQSTLLINNPCQLPSLFLILLSPFDLCTLVLILFSQIPQHTYIFHLPPLLAPSPALHFRRDLVLKFTLLSTSVNPLCFPSDLKASQGLLSSHKQTASPAFPFI